MEEGKDYKLEKTVNEDGSEYVRVVMLKEGKKKNLKSNPKKHE